MLFSLRLNVIEKDLFHHFYKVLISIVAFTSPLTTLQKIKDGVFIPFCTHYDANVQKRIKIILK